MRILVQKLSKSTETVFLSMLQIELIGYTHVRAHDLTRSESRSWVIMSQSNMNIPLGEPSDPVGKEWNVPSRYWENIPLPNTVAPSFDTCNISRNYELEIRVGLSHGGGIESIKPEIIVLPLRLPVKVYSGIAPPAALLQKIAISHSSMPSSPFAATPGAAGAPTPLSPSSFYPPTPTTPSYFRRQPPAPAGIANSYYPNSRPSQPPEGVDDDEAPPSYEDAMADEIAPVDGPRRDYSVPTPSDRRDSGFGVDSKGESGAGGGGGGHIGNSMSGLGRRVSERLFPQNGTGRGAGATVRMGFTSGRPSTQSPDDAGPDDSTGGDGVSSTFGQTTNSQQRLARKPTLPPTFEESINPDRDRR